MTYFGSGNGYTGLEISWWQIALGIVLMLVGLVTIVVWVIEFLCAHLSWL